MARYDGRIETNGQITLPPEWMDKFGVLDGDAVFFIELDDGTLNIVPRRAIAVAAMKEISEALQATGITLEEWLEEGEKIRQEMYDEQQAQKKNNESS